MQLATKQYTATYENAILCSDPAKSGKIVATRRTLERIRVSSSEAAPERARAGEGSASW